MNVATGGNDGSMDNPDYLITNPNVFNKFKIVAFCNFLQHYENNTCMDNEKDHIYIGLPSNWDRRTYALKTLTCKSAEQECLKDSDSINCASLNFIC
jgi:hypothetical protein